MSNRRKNRKAGCHGLRQVPPESWLYGLSNIISPQLQISSKMVAASEKRPPTTQLRATLVRKHCHSSVHSARHANWVAGLATQAMADFCFVVPGFKPGTAHKRPPLPLSLSHVPTDWRYQQSSALQLLCAGRGHEVKSMTQPQLLAYARR